MIHSGIEALFDQFDQTRWNQIVIIGCLGIIPNGCRIAHDDKNVTQTEGMGRQEIALYTQ